MPMEVLMLPKNNSTSQRPRQKHCIRMTRTALWVARCIRAGKKSIIGSAGSGNKDRLTKTPLTGNCYMVEH